MSKKVSITIVPKQVGEMIDELVERTLNQLSAKPRITQNQKMQEMITHQYNPNYNIHQGKCYQQFSPNLCGYHAIFNTFCFLKMLNGPSCQYNIESGVSFWKFKTKVQNFLLETKKKHKLKDEWPWRISDIREGDFERTYNKLCMDRFQEFQIFRKHEKFYYISHTWQFQYQNLIGQLQSKRDMEDKFAQFRYYDGYKPLVLHLMLAITTHWLTFLAVKSHGKTQYWFFDSHNNYYLEFDWQQIIDFVRKKSEQRTKYNKPQFTKFQKQSYSQCMKDIQTSLKLIIDCLEGKDSLASYEYNRRFSIFGEPFEVALGVEYNQVAIVVKEYQHNIRQFFKNKIEWQLLNQENTQRMNKIIKASKDFRKRGNEGEYMYNLLRKWSKI